MALAHLAWLLPRQNRCSAPRHDVQGIDDFVILTLRQARRIYCTPTAIRMQDALHKEIHYSGEAVSGRKQIISPNRRPVEAIAPFTNCGNC